MTDSYRHQGLRKKLIESLRSKGIADENVLTVMNQIPRHVFVDDAFVSHIYEDKAFPIGADQTISHPSTVAYQTTLLKITKDDIILEVGTGSGYQTLVLAALAKYVLTIERQRELFKKTKEFLPSFGNKNIKYFYGDGYRGLAAYSPFNKIIVTAAAPFVPENLLAQLKEGGRMIVPVDNGEGGQTMQIIDKDLDGQLHYTTGNDFKFVPMLKGKNR